MTDRELAESVPCPCAKCRAPAGAPCMKNNGRGYKPSKRAPHATRLIAAGVVKTPPPKKPEAQAIAEMLAAMERLDPGHRKEHISILRTFSCMASRRRFLREIVTDILFSRAQQKPWALRAAAEVARLEREVRAG